MTEKKRSFFVVIIALAAVLVSALCFVSPRLSGPEPALPVTQVQIIRAGGRAEVFSMEVATTQEQLERGLMFRTSLPQDAGMLFVFRPAQIVQFWMKDTLIPLDMIFFGEDRRILKIAAHTKPQDTTAISSGAPVAGVIEINAGEAKRRGIAVGDVVAYELK